MSCINATSKYTKNSVSKTKQARIRNANGMNQNLG